MDFFILGNPRSGTTLLRLMLNTHSKIGVPPECGMILWWYNKYQDWSLESYKDKERVDQFIKDILSSKKIEEWGLSLDDLVKVFDQQPKDYKEVFYFLYQNYTNKEITGDKNNYYIKELDLLNKVYPNSKFIHLVRDGRDVACSYLRVKDLERNLKYFPVLPDNIKSIAQEWTRNIANIDRFIEHKRAYVLRYEDLITSPTEILSELCRFLNVEFEEGMLNFSQHNNEPVSTLKWKLKTLEVLDNNNFHQFYDIFSAQDITDFNDIARVKLLKYNYEVKC